MPLSDEERRQKLREWGRKGGKARVPKGASMATPEQRREWGRKGALIKRKKHEES